MLGIFLKYPQPGRVKGRLAAEVGNETACDIYKLCVEALVSECLILTPTLFYDPEVPLSAYEDWLGRRRWRPQRGTSLGERMRNALEDMLVDDWKALLVNTDSPHLCCAALENSLAALDTADAVLGPRPQGDYYLVGVRRGYPAGMFEGVDWCSANVLRQTLMRLAGRRVALLGARGEVDTLEDLWRVLPDVTPSLRREVLSLLALAAVH